MIKLPAEKEPRLIAMLKAADLIKVALITAIVVGATIATISTFAGDPLSLGAWLFR